ncbi:hypothetical protein KAI04_04020 [Candidatus Pacearchaeota archaeon]|nr:hypothetical protein [Candidatus Pacearchaeota archaeon]
MDEIELKKKKEEFIREIIKRQPDMQVLFIDKINNKGWQTEKIITDLTNEEKLDVNLIKSFKNEIILDIEERYKFNDIKNKLDDLKWSYEVYDTSSRGIHISIKFDNLADKPLELRNRIRKYIINLFETDDKLSKESQWIAIPWGKHFKTGKEKTLLDIVNTGKPNILKLDIIEYAEDDLNNKKKKQLENKQIIKDYHKNDPYLKYVMEKVIESGDRNNILFKNFAIGLVNSGLTREEIIPYANTVVANCPGKNVGEFMGWVDKSLVGELNDYNKSEMKQWSMRYGHPVMYEMETDEAFELMSIKQLWDEIWNHKITSQSVWKDLCFYNLIGTLIDENKEDYRVNLIFSSPSGTGKDEGMNIVRDILERLQLTVYQPATITDRTLLGAVNQKATEYNTQYGLSEIEPIKGNKEWKDPVEKGILDDANWIGCSESEFIFKPGSYNRNIQLILRQAMDKSRLVSKGVGGHIIPVKTNTSFILTTYSMDTIINSVLHNGLFQRCLFYCKMLAKGEHKTIRKHINKHSFNTKYRVEFNEDKFISKFLEKLRNMKKWYIEHKSDIEFEEGSDTLVDKLWDKVEADYETYFAEDKNILDSMVRRLSKYVEKLTILNGVWNMNNNIKHDQIKESFELIKICIDSVKDMVMRQDKNKKIQYSILNTIAKESISKMVLHKAMDETYKIKSPNKRTQIINQLINKDLISTFKSGRNDMLIITTKGNEYLTYEE